MMTSADKKRLKEMQVDARTVPLGEKERWLIAQLEAAEATCQSLLDQSSRWEAQALEAESEAVRQRERAEKLRQELVSEISRAEADRMASYERNSSIVYTEPQEGKERSRE